MKCPECGKELNPDNLDKVTSPSGEVSACPYCSCTIPEPEVEETEESALETGIIGAPVGPEPEPESRTRSKKSSPK